ncbi:YIP1 family protein [Methanorbis rubei]|uniref:Yip1 domain-containing protein n=1 Tax=Methanorbis rubei TaxID=3028300 RepID=A0AAE4SBR8_9EURY|nr:hypothetical protein [Methanocorpusculaceae archaeon Cs1]
MTFATDVLALLLDPKTFFADSSKTSSLKLPVLFTAIYAVVVAVVSAQASAASAEMLGLGSMTGMMQGIGAVSGLIMTFISWLVVALVFFVFIKFIAHTQSGFKPFLIATGYASLPLLIGAVLTLIVDMIAKGTFDGWMGFVLNLVILLWCIPIWAYGCAAAGNVPVSAVFTAILIPIILMIAFTAWGTYTNLEAMNNLQTGGLQVSMGPQR